jgi:protein-L-isoaspartate(D-aspartate) O-methyltransferase
VSDVFGHLDRERMVSEQIRSRGVRDERVLRAMGAVPRHLFVPERERLRSYADTPLPIGEGQTISQPYIVAAMCEALDLHPDSKVLEIGTGSGYQAAVLGELCSRVITVEIIESLFLQARELLERLGYDHVECLHGDGSRGILSSAPYDAVAIAAATPRIAPEVLGQLADGGRLVYPEGAAKGYQELIRVVRVGSRFERSVLMSVRFVPMTGNASI